MSRRLATAGHQVVVLDNKQGLECDELRRLGVDVRIGSVTDPDLVASCTKGVEFVHHVAAAFRELGVPENLYDEVNVKGTANVFEAA